MENEDKNIGLIQNESEVPNSSNVFKPSYENQKLDNNADYQKWKSSMINKYGDKGKLYKCPIDKIYFYTSDEESGINHKNEGFCPICKRYICFFCLQFVPTGSYDLYNCCVKRKLVEMYKSGIEYCNIKIKDYGDYEERALKYFLIPGVNLIFLIGIIFNFSYYKLVYVYENGNPYGNECFLHQNYLRFSWILAINGITSIFLSIPFIVYTVYASILILISIIINQKIFSFFVGVINEDWPYINKNFHKVFHING